MYDPEMAEAKTPVISDSRGGCGQSPLEVHEQAPLSAPITSEGTIEMDIVTKHHLYLLSLPWEFTHPAIATAKKTQYVSEEIKKEIEKYLKTNDNE